MPFIKTSFNTLFKLIKNRSIKDLSFARFKEDYLKKWNESDSFEKFAGIGFSLFVIIIAIFIPNEEQQKYSKFITLFGIVMLVVMAERAKKAKKDVIEKNKEIEKQKHLVEEKNKEILDSIEYALRIQTAILPPKKIIKQYLGNSFILYKPKDIVAGDFYWMESLDELVLFAACDCTGHGVPGAMVSVVCNNALNRTVREFKLTQPAAILDKTLELVIDHFSKSEEEIKDGMDISICALNLKTKKLEWSGANNPLWLIQNGEIIETKADKQPIGKTDSIKLFTNHSFNLNSGDAIYLFTDGFADQFGGETGQKKLTRKRFKELVLGIQEKSMEEQGIILDNFIVNYRNQIEQIDDILVMGVKI
jgi:serine phosphatase RsbU (regulator of sigma subunit)